MSNEIGFEIIKKNAAAVATAIRTMEAQMQEFNKKIESRDAQIAQLRQEVEQLKTWRQQQLVAQYSGGQATHGGDLHDDG